MYLHQSTTAINCNPYTDDDDYHAAAAAAKAKAARPTPRPDEREARKQQARTRYFTWYMPRQRSTSHTMTADSADVSPILTDRGHHCCWGHFPSPRAMVISVPPPPNAIRLRGQYPPNSCCPPLMSTFFTLGFGGIGGGGGQICVMLCVVRLCLMWWAWVL